MIIAKRTKFCNSHLLNCRARLLCTSPEKRQKKFLIPFHGEQISVIQQEDKELLVPLRELCNNLGVRWDSQYRRIKEDPVLNSAVAVRATVAPDGKIRETLTLPLLNGFYNK